MSIEDGVNDPDGVLARVSREVISGAGLPPCGGAKTPMPLYMDVHRDVEADETEIATAHARDLEVQGDHGVKYRNYWVDAQEGAVFCLFEAPSKEAGEAVHREAHGLVADEIFEVREGA